MTDTTMSPAQIAMQGQVNAQISEMIAGLGGTTNTVDYGSALDAILGGYQQYSPELSQMGLDRAAEFIPQYADIFRQSMSADRNSGMSDLLSLSPYVTALQRAKDGGTIAGMRDTLNSQIANELSMGGALTAAQNRQAEQGLRSSEAARGIANSGSSASREAVTKALQSMDLASQRQSKAMEAINLASSTTLDPVSTVLSLPTTATSNALAAYDANQSAVGMDLFNNNYWNSRNDFWTGKNFDLNTMKYGLELGLAATKPENPWYDDTATTTTGATNSGTGVSRGQPGRDNERRLSRLTL